MLLVLAVGLGGALGSIARFLISSWVQQRSHSGFPWGTYTVNGTGCLVIGVVFALAEAGAYSGNVLTFLVAGILGGYTTFSTFSIENLSLLEKGRYGSLLHNSLGQIAGGLLFAAVGFWLGSAVM